LEARYVLAVHSTCASSRSLLHALRERGLLDRLVIARADAPALGGVPLWSVPLLISPRGEPLAMDPLGPEEVEAILSRSYRREGDPVEDLYNAVLYSSYATVLALVQGGLEPLIREDSFLVPGLRLWAREEGIGEVRRLLLERAGELYRDWWEVLARAASIAYARTLLWVVGPERLEGELAASTRERVASWMLAAASVGRAGLPARPGVPEAAEYIAGFASRRARGLARKVVREQEEVLGDEWFMSVVSRAGQG